MFRGNLLLLLIVFSLNACNLFTPTSGEYRIVGSDGRSGKFARKVPVLNQEELKKQNNPMFLGEESAFTSRRTAPQVPIEVPETKLPQDLFADKPAMDDHVYNAQSISPYVGNTGVNNYRNSYVDSNNTINLNEFDKRSKEDAARIEKLKKAQEDRIREERAKLEKESDINNNSVQKDKKIVIKKDITSDDKSQTTPILPTTPVRIDEESKKETKLKKGFYIQIGTFSTPENAEKALNTYSNISTGTAKETTNTNMKTMYRALLGPISTKKEAEAKMEKVIETGHYDVFITER